MGTPPTQQYHQPVQNEPLNGCIIAILIGCAIFIPVLGPLAAIIIGAMSTKKGGGVAVLVTGIIMILLNIALFVFFFMAAKAVVEETGPLAGMMKSGMYEATGIQLQGGLETYQMDNGRYPDNLTDMIMSGDLASMPINPSNIMSGEFLEQIDFGDRDYAGNATYITFDDGAGYYLLIYGDEEGQDVDGDGEGDHVVSILKGGSGHPDLEDLLSGHSDSSSGGGRTGKGK